MVAVGLGCFLFAGAETVDGDGLDSGGAVFRRWVGRCAMLREYWEVDKKNAFTFFLVLFCFVLGGRDI